MVSFVNFCKDSKYLCGFSSWYIAWLLFPLKLLAKSEFPARISNKTCLKYEKDRTLADRQDSHQFREGNDPSQFVYFQSRFTNVYKIRSCDSVWADSGTKTRATFERSESWPNAVCLGLIRTKSQLVFQRIQKRIITQL